MLYKHGHVPGRFSQPLGSLPSANGRRAIADPEWHPHHLPLVCLGDPKAPRTDSTSGPMMGVPPGPAILQAAPGCTRMGSLPSANRPRDDIRERTRIRGHNMSGVSAQHIHGAGLGERPTGSAEQFKTSTTLGVRPEDAPHPSQFSSLTSQAHHFSIHLHRRNWVPERIAARSSSSYTYE